MMSSLTRKKDLIYARTDRGGAYRWKPGTSTWTQLLNWVSSDQWNMTSVESLTTDPVDPNRLYIATGTYTNSWTSMSGVILRSTDQGNTFQQTTMPFKMGGTVAAADASRVLWAPKNAQISYSTDNGNTWTASSNIPRPLRLPSRRRPG